MARTGAVKPLQWASEVAVQPPPRPAHFPPPTNPTAPLRGEFLEPTILGRRNEVMAWAQQGR